MLPPLHADWTFATHIDNIWHSTEFTHTDCKNLTSKTRTFSLSWVTSDVIVVGSIAGPCNIMWIYQLKIITNHLTHQSNHLFKHFIFSNVLDSPGLETWKSAMAGLGLILISMFTISMLTRWHTSIKQRNMHLRSWHILNTWLRQKHMTCITLTLRSI